MAGPRAASSERSTVFKANPPAHARPAGAAPAGLRAPGCDPPAETNRLPAFEWGSGSRDEPSGIGSIPPEPGGGDGEAGRNAAAPPPPGAIVGAGGASAAAGRIDRSDSGRALSPSVRGEGDSSAAKRYH